MGVTFFRKLPTPKELKEQFPLGEKLEAIKRQRDKEMMDLFTGKSRRFLLIIGPCSADNEAAVLEYLYRLAKLQEDVKDKIYIVPRVYTNKPRTVGLGYKGMLHQPDTDKPEDLWAGIIAIRQMHTKVLRETGFTSADEMLYSENYRYLSDLLGYVAIGARSVEDQQHRLVSSGITIPVGMKNPTNGNLGVVMNSITAAQNPQRFIYRGWEVQTEGNPLVHCILRGYLDRHGRSHPNYHYEDLQRLLQLYSRRELKYPAVVVDTNHANSGKEYQYQERIAKDIIHSRNYSKDIKNLVKGLMIESYLVDGRQDIGGGVFGQSITDACLGWEKSRRLVYQLADML